MNVKPSDLVAAGTKCTLKQVVMCAKMAIVVNVGHLLADTALQLRGVTVPFPDRDIRWVATSELPDPTPFLRGGEVLLTTGIQTLAWAGEWQAYVDALSRCGAAGIGFGTGLTYAEMPDALVDACRNAELNLFEVPRGTPFVAVSYRVSRLFAQEEQASARQSLEIQHRLTAAAAKPGATRAVLAVLAHALDGAAAVVAYDGQIEVGPVGSRRGELRPDRLSDEITLLRQQRNRSAITLADPSATTIVQPIGATRRQSSILVALGPTRLADSQRNAVSMAVALLGLVAAQQSNAAHTRRLLRGRAVELLVAAEHDTAELVLGIDPESPDVPVALRVLHAAGSSESLLDAMSVAEQRSALVAHHDDELWLVVADAQTPQMVTALADAGARVGVGARVGPEEAGASHRTAGVALAQAGPATPVVEWDTLLGQGPLGLIDPAQAALFAQSVLGDLDGEQITTLRVFLQHHGSQLKVAEALGLHRNTVRKRLAGIAAKLSGSLDDPQVRVSAWIALQSLPLTAER